jgi:hypothetical protein
VSDDAWDIVIAAVLIVAGAAILQRLTTRR